MAPDDEERAVRDFITTCEDITWRSLFAQVDTAITRVREALTLLKSSGVLPSTAAAEEKIEGRITMVNELVGLARAFRKDFSKSDDDHYSEAFFHAISQVQDTAMKRWTEWAENLGIVARDLILFEALIRAVATHGMVYSGDASTSVAARLAASHRIVISVENNLAIAMSEFMATIGFLPRGYSGSLEQISSYDSVNMGAQGTNFEKRFLEKLFTTAWHFPLLETHLCNACGRAGTSLAACSRCQVCLRDHTLLLLLMKP
jgi:hypothetical protein